MEFRHDRGGGNQQERMVAVQDEIRQRKAACNDAAQRCARLCVESEASAAATLTTLYSQGKQLERIDRKMTCMRAACLCTCPCVSRMCLFVYKCLFEQPGACCFDRALLSASLFYHSNTLDLTISTRVVCGLNVS
eukprot:m.100432 g.100432  ORF g.100432 m.100432 type:complete len:135 (+) comp15398_c1_seq3:224-628(+)